MKTNFIGLTGLIKIISFVLTFSGLKAQTLIMNEVSNGPSGNKEYVEFVVVDTTVVYNCASATPPCIDIRGWIFDDNSGYHGASGIATGAVRFSFDPLWSCVPLGTIILIYNNGDVNADIPPADLSLTDGNCTIIAPINNAVLFESNATTPGAAACSYPAAGWTPGGNWNNTLLANVGDCARIVNLAGCEVFSVCWGSDNANTLIYFAGSGTDKVWYFNNGNPSLTANWTSACADPGSCGSDNETPGAPNNAANAAYIAQFNNGCTPITPISASLVTSVNAGCSCTGSATVTASGSIAGYTYAWYSAAFVPIGQTTATATGLCTGTYNCIATSSIGCSDTVTVTIGSSGGAPVVNVAPAAICNGSNTVLTAAGATTYTWSPATGLSATTGTSVTANPAVTTTYTVVGTTAGCSGTTTVTVTVNPLPVINCTPATICSGSNTVLTAGGASTYTWSPATGLSATTGTSVTASPTVTTTYTISGTDVNGCVSSNTVIVTVNPLPSISCAPASICSGSNTVLTAAGASTYAWSPVTGLSAATGTSVTASPTATTTYTITGTDVNGCVSTTTVTVTVNPLPSITVNNGAICLGAHTVLTASGASTYAWSPATGLSATTGASVTANPVTTTIYTITGTDVNGCINTVNSTVTVNLTSDATITPVGTFCQDNGPIALNAVDAGGSWSASCGACINTVSGVFDPALASAGSNTVTYLIPGACGDTNSISIMVNPVPDVIVSPQTICSGQTTSVNLSSSVAGTTFSWTSSSAGVTGDAGGSGSTIAQTLTATAAPSGTVTYTITPTAAGCNGLGTNVAVTVELVLINSVNTTNVTCNGLADGTITVNASGATQYSIDGGLTFQSSNLFVVAAGTYTVVAENANGCQDQTSVTITEPAALGTPVSNSPETCFGSCDGIAGTAPTGGTSPYVYLWNTGATGPFITGCVGAYTVTVTDANGCTQVASVNITGPAPVNITSVIFTTPTCHSGNDATITISAPANVTQFSIDGGTTYQPSVFFGGLTAGSYTITVSDVTGCTHDTVLTITEPAALVLTTSPDSTICAGSSITISANASGGTPPYTYTWDHALPLGSNQLVAPIVNEIYNVVVTDANGCTVNGDVAINVGPVLTVNAFSYQAVCPGSSANISAVANGGVSPYSFTWTNNSDATILSGSNQVVSPGITTLYTISVSDNCGMSVSDTVSIAVFQLPVLSYTLDTNQGCSPLAVNFTNTTPGAALCEWDFGDGSSGSNCNDIHIFTITGCYTISLLVTTNDGCQVDTTINNQVCVFSQPIADFSFSPQPTDIFNTEINFVNLSQGAISYSWDFAGIGSATLQNPVFTFPSDSAGNYLVCLSALNNMGCVDSICHTIIINGYSSIYVPNAFTPEGINNYFFPVAKDISSDNFSFMIFDRWGELIFQSTTLDGKWDGTHNNIKCKEDIYVWKIKYEEIETHERRQIYGHVSLLR